MSNITVSIINLNLYSDNYEIKKSIVVRRRFGSGYDCINYCRQALDYILKLEFSELVSFNKAMIDENAEDKIFDNLSMSSSFEIYVAKYDIYNYLEESESGGCIINLDIEYSDGINYKGSISFIDEYSNKLSVNTYKSSYCSDEDEYLIEFDKTLNKFIGDFNLKYEEDGIDYKNIKCFICGEPNCDESVYIEYPNDLCRSAYQRDIVNRFEALWFHKDCIKG